MAALTVEDRLAERRGRLQPFCVVDPVKQHLRLPAYHQLARQLFKQMEAYVASESWDQAYVVAAVRWIGSSHSHPKAPCLVLCVYSTSYVYLARFVKYALCLETCLGLRFIDTGRPLLLVLFLHRLCSRVIPAHIDYNNPKFEKERKWISSVCVSRALAGRKGTDRLLDCCSTPSKGSSSLTSSSRGWRRASWGSCTKNSSKNVGVRYRFLQGNHSHPLVQLAPLPNSRLRIALPRCVCGKHTTRERMQKPQSAQSQHS
jgi:hypothetical protein